MLWLLARRRLLARRYGMDIQESNVEDVAELIRRAKSEEPSPKSQVGAGG
jgi:hypothetical protein